MDKSETRGAGGRWGETQTDVIPLQDAAVCLLRPSLAAAARAAWPLALTGVHAALKRPALCSHDPAYWRLLGAAGLQ